MKQLISISLAVLLIIALTACVKYTTESEYSAMTTEPVEMVEVEVLAEQIYYDVEGKVLSRWEFFYDAMGRETRALATDSEGNVLEEYRTRWNEDKSYVNAGFWYSQEDDKQKVYIEARQDAQGGMQRVAVYYSGEEITYAEFSARDPYGNWATFSADLDIARYLAGDWGSTGWHYSTDQEGNLLSWIEVTTLGGVVRRAEIKCRPNGDLVYNIVKTDGVVTDSEEISYDEKGRPVRAVDAYQIREWIYNDATNTGECISYVSDYWGEYEGYRKNWSEEYIFDRNGNPATVYGQRFDRSSQTVSGTYTAASEYDENNVCRYSRVIDGNTGEVAVYTYDAHGNQIFTANYNAGGTLVSSSRTDYIYITIQVTAEAAEMYHSE